MIAQELVRPGTAFVGADGEIRHVIILHKLGRGWGVTWDSIPRSNPDYYKDLFKVRDSRPKGYMTMRKFQKWATSQAEQNKEQSHVQ